MSIAPFGVPVVPDVDTTTATSSSMSSPALNDGCQQAGLTLIVGRDGQHGGDDAAESAFHRGQHR